MLAFAGIQLALLARDQRLVRALLVMLTTAVGIVVINTLAGFLIGMLVYILISRDRS
jgi:hypothetical protein